MNNTENEDITVELKNGKAIDVNISYDIITDYNYGADIDNNRGTEKQTIENLEYSVKDKLSIDEMIELWDKCDNWVEENI